LAGTGNRLDANPVDAGDNTGTLSVKLKPGAGREAEDRTMQAMRAELSTLAGVQYEFTRPSLMSFASPLQIEISGYDLANLSRVSQSVVQAMSASDRFTDIKTTVESGNPEIQIVFDQERAAKLGLAVRDIANIVVANVRGELATRYTWRDKKIDVLVRSVDTRQSSIEEVRKLIVNPNSPRPVTLDAVAEITVSQGPAEIRRVAQDRVALVSANLAYGDLGAAAIEAGNIVSKIPLPAGISVIVAGRSASPRADIRATAASTGTDGWHTAMMWAPGPSSWSISMT